MTWNVFGPLEGRTINDTPYVDEISQELLNSINAHLNDTNVHVTSNLIDKINNSVTIQQVQQQINGISVSTTKDIVFKMIGPLELGVQEDTEFLYPYEGTITNINTSISLDSVLDSNIIIYLQAYINDAWVNISDIILQVNQYSIDTAISYDLSDDTRLRIILADGNITNVNDITIVANVTSTGTATSGISDEYLISLINTVLDQRGIGEDKNFVFNQSTPSTTWVIEHNMGKYPSITVINDDGEVMGYSADYDSINQITISFYVETSGKAILN